jgi:hypothetical protein
MHSLTYKDIIDGKIMEWHKELKKLEEHIEKATSDTKATLSVKMEELKKAIDSAIVQLRDLDEKETANNTMDTKDKILKIFNSIDKDFTGYEDKTPYML